MWPIRRRFCSKYLKMRKIERIESPFTDRKELSCRWAPSFPPCWGQWWHRRPPWSSWRSSSRCCGISTEEVTISTTTLWLVSGQTITSDTISVVSDQGFCVEIYLYLYVQGVILYSGGQSVWGARTVIHSDTPPSWPGEILPSHWSVSAHVTQYSPLIGWLTRRNGGWRL